MLKPYSETTYKKKIRDTGIPKEVVNLLDRYLVSIAHFYLIIELDCAWNIIKKQTDIKKSDFDTLIPIMARNIDAIYTIRPQSDYYVDGSEELLLTDQDAFIVFKAPKDGNDKLELNEDISLEEIFEFDMDAWCRLDEARFNKPMYVPSDLLSYYDYEYIEETPYVAELRHFLEKDADFDVKKTLQNPEKDIKLIDRKEYRQNLVNETLFTIVNENIRGPIKIDNIFTQIFDTLDEFGFIIKDEKQSETLINILSRLNNNTRQPVNKGYTPIELRKIMPQNGVPIIQFGPGLQNSIQSGKIDGEDLKKAIANNPGLPIEMRANLINEVEKSLGKGEEKWVNGTLVKGEKIGPNDPCPCGSGKKYKKCCGSKS